MNSKEKTTATRLRKSNFIMSEIPRVVIHPSFDDYTFENDYALIELEESIDFKADFNVTAPCCLPTEGVGEGVGEGQKEYVRSGFQNSFMSSKFMKKVENIICARNLQQLTWQ